tara:strand:- start:50221 stop:52158 length:1938 start_codon:yes stop_codon:yes gene_type:complete
MKPFKLFFLLTSLLQLSLLWGQIRLPKLISDGAVLQRDTEIKIWGWASPEEEIFINFIDKPYTTKADKHGKWHVAIPVQKAGGPYTMILKGKNTITLKNILIGEVWLCSGQSNMELTMARLQDKYPEAIKNSNNSKIRQFLVPDTYNFIQEQTDLSNGSWIEASQESIMDFSGVAYFFAMELYEKYQVPIGLINAALGGSPVEAWISEDALKPFDEAYSELQRFKNQDLITEIERNDKKRQENWYQELNAKDKGFVKGSEWFLINYDDEPWASIQVPGYWEDQGLSEVDGVVWYRKTIKIPESMVAKEAKLWMGRSVDQDHVFINGVFIGSTGYQYPPRKYLVPKDILVHGENTITVRLINEQGKGGFILEKPYFLAVGKDSIDLKGNWKYQLGTEMKPLQSPTFIRWKPAGLYNSMIAPLLNYKIKGAIWYQGESNTNNPNLYNSTFPALINNWRAKWDIGAFPFIFVQLANYMEETEIPTESQWANLRQAQLNTLKLANTGMVVATDLGEWNDIHPLNKKSVGQRLALNAQKLAYYEDIVSSGPIFKTSEIKGNQITISFSEIGTGLISRDGEALRKFEISGPDEKFVRAEAKIVGNTVIVSNDSIQNPTYVRYAWADNPFGANLYNKEGLPASAFRNYTPNP